MKTAFLKLHHGENIVRALTPPFLYAAHSAFVAKDNPYWGQKLRCPIDPANSEVECGLCKCSPHIECERRYMLGVISREDNKPYFLDIDIEVFSGLRTLTLLRQWGNPTKYDVVFYNGWDDLTYVVPLPATPYEAGTDLVQSLKAELTRLSQPGNPLDLLPGMYEEVSILINRDMCESSADL